MKSLTIWSCVLCVSVLASSVSCQETRKTGPKEDKSEQKDVFNFDDATVGETPKGWTVAETKGAGTPATWKVEAFKDDPKQKNAVRVDSKNKEAVFNILLSDKTYAADVDMTVRVLSISGEDDQGGGLVWRAKDGDNYYITRWNPLEKNLRLYKVEGGARTQLKTADLEGDPKKWHEIRVVHAGTKITVDFDGKRVLEAEDSAFKDGGKVGLWTKADASTWFDDLAISWKK
jgi:hypothetical protein